MAENEKIYFEIFYHPNQYTSTFRYAFESLNQAKDLITKEYPDFKQAEEEGDNYPYISVSNKKYSNEEIVSLFFTRIKN